MKFEVGDLIMKFRCCIGQNGRGRLQTALVINADNGYYHLFELKFTHPIGRVTRWGHKYIDSLFKKIG